MCEFRALPVEVWHQILFAVIDVPYVLDTVIDPKGCYWRRQDLYHDDDAYAKSERQRRILRMVCHSWQSFADGHRYRWITYNSRADPKSARQKQAVAAMEAIQSIPVQSVTDAESVYHTIGKPRRIRFPVISSMELELLQSLTKHLSQKVTTLCLECPNDYRDEVFDLLISHKDMLPSLRCLMLTQPGDHLTPLQTISSAFPRLTGLTMSRYETVSHSPGDSITLPNLESLYLDVPTLAGLRPEELRMPGLLRLIIPALDMGDLEDVGLNIVRLHGSSLVFLDLTCKATGRLPIEFWTWCPALTEFVACFSRVDLGSVVPVGHPLQYIVHFPDPLFTQSEAKDDGMLWHNIRLLPSHLESFILSSVGGWSGYLERLEKLYDRDNVEKYFRRISLVCEEKSIRVEDESKLTLNEFLKCSFGRISSML
jgi:hypothetical protein